MRAVIATLIAAAVLAACATSQDKPATQPGAKVEDLSKPGDKTQVTRVEPGKPGGGSPFAALKDPNNILSKRSIFYDLDKYDVRDEYRSLVEAHAKFLRENPSAKMLIQGNTDERGSREYNVGLGQRRSDGVKRMLQLLGARDDQIESVSLGEEKPQSDGHDETAWSKNRRSDILYSGEY